MAGLMLSWLPGKICLANQEWANRCTAIKEKRKGSVLTFCLDMDSFRLYHSEWLISAACLLMHTVKDLIWSNVICRPNGYMDIMDLPTIHFRKSNSSQINIESTFGSDVMVQKSLSAVVSAVKCWNRPFWLDRSHLSAPHLSLFFPGQLNH